VRYWTEAEAREYLPRVKELVEQLRSAARVATHAKGNGHGPQGGATADPVAAMAELQEHDIIVRDLESGLIDFPARGADGIVYFLCWCFDDADLAWWHLPEDGFPGRQPLPRDPP
jgi:hypothetical protein